MTGTVIPQRLKDARLEQGFSQKELGIKAGFDEFVASARMNQYERGVHSPNFLTVSKIAEVLKLDPAYFYCADDQLASVIKIYSRATKKQKKQLSQVIAAQ